MMANQRKKTKKVISIPMEDQLLRELQAEAEEKGINRVALINEILAAAIEAAKKTK